MTLAPTATVTTSPDKKPDPTHADDENNGAADALEVAHAAYCDDPLLIAGMRRKVDPTTYRAEITAVVEKLEEAVANPALLAYLDPELRSRLVRITGQVSLPAKWEKRLLSKEKHRLRKQDRKIADEEILQQTGIRALRREEVFPTPHVDDVRDTVDVDSPAPRGEIHSERICYVCKTRYREIHHFYDQLCCACGDFNFAKRSLTADLRGRTALITGARVKIGYQGAILLLRAGARVIVLTRFARDAAMRYAREADFEQWRDRLEIHGLDLRHTPSVLAFTDFMIKRGEPLDFIVNNACQTVRRPSGFYAHLMETELAAAESLDPAVAGLLRAWEQYRAPSLPEGSAQAGSQLIALGHLDALDPVGITHAAALSQVPLLRDDLEFSEQIFPRGALDADLQQVDLRTNNSWRLTLAEVPAVELLEVQLVNAIAPFLLNSRLKPLMLKTPSRDKHIVNVSAVEGQFYRARKTDRHPHTNMAKAALNMMTRTSAPEYQQDGIHMNSVDTGWVTDEDPAMLAERKRLEHLFHPPLDIVDGAARIVDPILDGINTGTHLWGYFLKDYRPVPW